jgi:guanylate kinase
MEKVLGNLKQGLLFVLSAPAGTGKTTLIHRLTAEFPSVVQSITYTTREPREEEINGIHYHFISKEEFEKKIKNNDFLEFVDLYGYYYGTSREAILSELNQGKHVFLVIDTQGALKIRKIFPACHIFVLPPSLEELSVRLKKRKTETAESFQKRIELSKKEIALASQYDYNIVNDNLEVAYQVLRSIVIAEEHKVK